MKIFRCQILGQPGWKFQKSTHNWWSLLYLEAIFVFKTSDYNKSFSMKKWVALLNPELRSKCLKFDFQNHWQSLNMIMKASKFQNFCASRMSHCNFHNPKIARESNISRSAYIFHDFKNTATNCVTWRSSSNSKLTYLFLFSVKTEMVPYFVMSLVAPSAHAGMSKSPHF